MGATGAVGDRVLVVLRTHVALCDAHVDGLTARYRTSDLARSPLAERAFRAPLDSSRATDSALPTGARFVRWHLLDEQFHRAVTELLEDWSSQRGPEGDAVCVIADPASSRATWTDETKFDVVNSRDSSGALPRSRSIFV